MTMFQKNITFSYSENFNRVVELSVENYSNWKTNILYLLMINNLESYVLKEKVKKLKKRSITDDLDDYLDDKFDKNLVYDKDTNLLDIKNDVIVKWIIINSLAENTRKIISDQSKTAYEIWSILEKSFTRNPERRKLEIRNKINSLKFDEEQDINIFIANLQNAIDELENIDHDLEPSVKAGILNRSLPENLRFINVFQYKDNWQKLCDYVKNVIPDIVFSNMKETMKISEESKQIFMTTQKPKRSNKHKPHNQKYKNKRKNKNGKCYHCGKFGHYASECRQLKFRHYRSNNSKHKSTFYKNHTENYNNYHKHKSDKNQLNYINKDNNPNSNYRNNKYDLSNDYNTENGIFIGCILSKPSDDNSKCKQMLQDISVWILDSGSSIHITNSIRHLENIKNCNENIILPNGKMVLANYRGDFTGYINSNKLTLRNVYYVPTITKNIISINKLTMENYKIIFFNHNNESYASIYDKHKNRITNIKSNKQNIFTIWISITPLNFNNSKSDNLLYSNLYNITKLDKINLWHRRLGHFNIDKIKNNLLKYDIKTKCPICSNSKMKNAIFKKAENNTNTTFELIHTDIVGPVNESLHGNRYFLTILDDYSRFSWVFFIENKSDTFDKFIHWFNEITNIFNKTIKYIRSDNGKEFSNNKFKSFCTSHGIIQQFTIPHNPQQNGRAERLNGILISSAKALLNDAKLSHEFWEYAVDTANYIHNRLPHSSINNKIPFKVLYKKDVNYSP